MELNRSTIGALVSELAQLGAVREERPGGSRSTAGRPSLVVRPRADRVQVLAVDVGVQRLRVALVGLGGQVIARRYRTVTTSTPEAVARLLGTLVEAVLRDPAAGQRVIGVGVAIAGVVRQHDGCVRFAPNLGWRDAPFGDLVGDRLGTTAVRIGNDADLGALAEHLRGAARGVDNVVFLSGDIGVGGGLILDGHPLRGAGGYAGELGHMTVRPDGRACRCGATGCWETEIGAGAVARALGIPGAGGQDVIAALHRLDGTGPAVLGEVAHHLGVGLASLVNLVNPQQLILGGLLEEVYRVCGPLVEQELRRAALAAPAEQVRIRTPELGDDVLLAGAAELAWEPLLADPAGLLRRPPGRPGPGLPGLSGLLDAGLSAVQDTMGA
jgi:predicted NBD/HSP70 family sugar kinase